MTTKKKCLVPAVERAFKVIELLGSRDSGMSLSQIQKELSLPVSSVANMLYTLTDLGYLDRDDNAGRYSLGTKFLALGQRVLEGIDFQPRCHPILEELAQQTNLTAHLAINRDGNSVYVDRVAGGSLMQITSYIGMSWPLHISAAGKALLAFLPKDELNATLEKYVFVPLTSNSITSQHELERNLRQTRRCGYSTESSEGEEGVACVAAPVFGPGNRLIAAVSLSGTKFQIPRSSFSHYGGIVKEYADRMTRRMCGVGTTPLSKHPIQPKRRLQAVTNA